MKLIRHSGQTVELSHRKMVYIAIFHAAVMPIYFGQWTVIVLHAVLHSALLIAAWILFSASVTLDLKSSYVTLRVSQKTLKFYLSIRTETNL